MSVCVCVLLGGVLTLIKDHNQCIVSSCLPDRWKKCIAVYDHYSRREVTKWSSSVVAVSNLVCHRTSQVIHYLPFLTNCIMLHISLITTGPQSHFNLTLGGIYKMQLLTGIIIHLQVVLLISHWWHAGNDYEGAMLFVKGPEDPDICSIFICSMWSPVKMHLFNASWLLIPRNFLHITVTKRTSAFLTLHGGDQQWSVSVKANDSLRW